MGTTITSENKRISPKTIVFLLLAILLYVLITWGFAIKYFIADESMWEYVTRVWLNLGIAPYTGAAENKTPGIFYLFAAAHFFPWAHYVIPRLVSSFFLTGAGFLLWRLGRFFAGEAAGVWTLSFYCVLLLLGETDAGNFVTTETFVLGFSALAFWFYSAQGRREYNVSTVLYAGFAMGAAVLFKKSRSLQPPRCCCGRSSVLVSEVAAPCVKPR